MSAPGMGAPGARARARGRTPPATTSGTTSAPSRRIRTERAARRAAAPGGSRTPAVARRPRRVPTAALAATLAFAPALLTAQERPQPTQEVPGLPPALPVSPGGAFARALAFPGWGHAAIGSYVRGGVYFSAQAATLYTYARTRGRLNEVRKSVRFRETVLLRELANEGVTEPDQIEDRLDADARLSELEILQESREAQQEDLIAFSIFLVLISAADAYVTAHLARFPDPLDVDAAPSIDGGVDLAVRVRLPN